MSTRYKGKFTDTRNNYTWEVHLFDSNYTSYTDRVEADGGTVESIGCLPLEVTELSEYKRMELGAEGFELEYGKRGDDWYKPIKGSRLVFNFICNDQDDLDYIDDIASTQEDRFYARLYRDGAIYWQGPILQDLIRVPYTSFPISVEIQAICGLGRLKGLSGLIIGYGNILEAISGILRRLDTASLWDDSDDFIRTSVRWFEDQMWTGSVPDGLDALAYSRIQRDFTEHTYDNEGNKIYRDYDELLSCILRVFNARIFQANGVWVIEQIGEIANNPSRYNVYQRQYDYSLGNPSGATGISSTGTSFTPFFQLFGTGTTNRISVDGSWTYLPSVKEYNIKYDLGEQSASWVVFLRNQTSYSTFGSVSADPNLGVFLELQMRWHRIVNATGSGEWCYVRAFATIRLVGTSTTYYLVPSASATVYNWSTTQGRVQVSDEIAFVPAGGNTLVTQVYPGIQINSADVPVSGDVEIQYEVELYQLNNPSQINSNVSVGSITTSDTNYYNNRGFRAYLNLAPYATEPLDSIQYIVENTVDTSSSVIEDLDEVFIGDQINSAGTNGQIEVYDVVNNVWEPSTTWKIRGIGATGKKILELLLTVMMQLRESPRRLFDIVYFGNLSPELSFRIGSTNARQYFWNWLKLTARSNQVQTEAYELEQSATSYNVTNDDVYVPIDFSNGMIRGQGVGTLNNTVNAISFPVGGLVSSEQSGTVTSIPVIGSLAFDIGFEGDTVQLLQTDGRIVDFTLSADALAGDSSLSVESQAISGVIGEGSRVLVPTVRAANKAEALQKFSIKSIPDSVLILQNEEITTSAGDITAWGDVSGSSNDFTAANVEPNYGQAFWAYFNGTSAQITNATILQTSGYTMAFLIYLEETATGRYILYGNSGNVYISTGTGDNVTLGTSTKSVTAEIVRNEWVVFIAKMNGVSSEWRTGFDSWTAANLDADTLETPLLGYDGSTNYCEMRLAALCIFANVITDDQANTITKTLQARI